MYKILLKTWVMCTLSIITLLVSLAYSLFTQDPQWIGRSGSIITIIGLLLTMKNSVLSSSRDIENVMNEKFHYAVYAPQKDSQEYNDQKKITEKNNE
jgi:hypothetical protein